MGPVNDFLVVYLDSIDKRLLVNRDQDDEVHDPRLPSQGDGGRALATTIGTV